MLNLRTQNSKRVGAAASYFFVGVELFNLASIIKNLPNVKHANTRKTDRRLCKVFAEPFNSKLTNHRCPHLVLVETNHAERCQSQEGGSGAC